MQISLPAICGSRRPIATVTHGSQPYRLELFEHLQHRGARERGDREGGPRQRLESEQLARRAPKKRY